jgi:hypothetical protein
VGEDAFPRELTVQERGVLDFILEQEWDGVERARQMLRDTRVTDMCDCGCGSLELSVKAKEGEEARFRSRVPVEGHAEMRPDGQGVGVALLIEDKRAIVELIWYSDDEPARIPLPHAHELWAVAPEEHEWDPKEHRLSRRLKRRLSLRGWRLRRSN